MNGKSIETNHQSKLNEDTMAKKQKFPEPEEPTPLLDLAAARLVKRMYMFQFSDDSQSDTPTY